MPHGHGEGQGYGQAMPLFVELPMGQAIYLSGGYTIVFCMPWTPPWCIYNIEDHGIYHDVMAFPMVSHGFSRCISYQWPMTRATGQPWIFMGLSVGCPMYATKNIHHGMPHGRLRFTEYAMVHAPRG